jgi:phage baseplate assembly protein W
LAIELEKSFVIDTQDKSVGVSLPIGGGNNGYFAVNYTTKNQIKSNLKNLILTEPGERLSNPKFGTPLRQFIFEPYEEGDFEMRIENVITDAISTYLPYVTIESIIFENNNDVKDKHLVNLELKYSINFSAIPTTDTLTISL